MALMREIRFRGKVASNNKWVYGSLDTTHTYAFPEWVVIRDPDGEYTVIPVTVSQFTGACDCCGNRIYEGDILRHTPQVPKYTLWGWGEGAINLIPECAVVEWNEFVCAFIGVWLPKGEVEEELPPSYVMSYMTEWEVIGNIYDNPELLEETNG